MWDNEFWFQEIAGYRGKNRGSNGFDQNKKE